MIKSNRNSDVLVTKVETVDEYVAMMTGERKKENNFKVLFAKK
jgi:hypothetical protein